MVLPNLPILLRKLDAFGNLSERPRSLKTAPLESLLAQTQTLRIAGLPPPHRPKLRLERLLRYGSKMWSAIGAAPEVTAMEAVYAARHEAAEMISLHDIFIDIPIFTNVQRIILGQRSHWTWSVVMEEKSMDPFRRYIDRFVSAHFPKTICTHSNAGPYYPVDASLAGSQLVNTQLTVTRHAYAHYEQATIIPGAKNRWTFYPGCMTSEPDSTIYGGPSPPGYSHFQDLYGSIARAVSTLHDHIKRESALESDKRTSLEMYGHAAGGPSLRERLLQAEHGSFKGGEIYQAAQSKQPGAYEEMLATYRNQSKQLQALEAGCNKRLADNLRAHGHLHQGEELADLVQLLPWRDTPPCECCGWELEDYIEEVTAGLTPREAVLIRALHSLESGAGKESDA